MGLVSISDPFSIVQVHTLTMLGNTKQRRDREREETRTHTHGGREGRERERGRSKGEVERDRGRAYLGNDQHWSTSISIKE